MWTTARDNSRHYHRSIKDRSPRHVIPVLVQRTGEELPTRYPSKKAAASALNVSKDFINNILSGQCKSKKFVVKLDNDDLPGEIWSPVVLTGARFEKPTM